MTVEYDLGAPETPPEPPDPVVLAQWRRRRIRTTVLLLVVVLAASVLVGVPALALRRVQPPVVGEPALPGRWYATPAHTPRVQDWPMAAAAMLLRDGDDWTLVSQRGTRYARLGLAKGDSLPALSDDGTLVGWLSVDGRGGGRVHVLRLLDGRSVSTPVPVAGFAPEAMRWNSGSFEITALGDVSETPGDPGDSGARGLSCLLAPVISRPDRLVSVGVLVEPSCSDTPAQAATMSTGSLSSDRYGTVRQAESGSNATLQRASGGAPTLGIVWIGRTSLPTYRTHPLTGSAPGLTVVSARLLAWTAAGLVVQVENTDTRFRRSGELRLVDPVTLAERVVSRSAAGGVRSTPTAVAPGAIGVGAPAPAVAPSYPFWRPATVAALTERLLGRDD